MEANSTFATALLAALPYFMRLESGYLRDSDKKAFQNESLENILKYDFIIVGAGTAGCVLANRLSQTFSVLLLEAGGDPPSSVSIPAFYDYVANSPDLNNFYMSIPQKRLNNRKMDKVVGKMMGGTSSHNTMGHCRGNPNDFDNWARILNDSNWKYKNLLKYFILAENYTGVWPIKKQHGRQGPFSIETRADPLDLLWRGAASELGIAYADPSGHRKAVFSPMDIMRKNGRRVSTYTAYVQPIIHRKNLDILRYTKVLKLLTSKRQVIGVQFLRHGKKFKAYVSKEVILCAGVFGSPLVLFRSGIGHSRMLKHAGIKTRLNLPAVGKYLQNHVGVRVSISVDSTYSAKHDKNLTAKDFRQFLNGKDNALLSSNGLGPQAYFVSSRAKAKGQEEWPDLQIFKVLTILDNVGKFATENKLFFDLVVTRRLNSRLGNLKLNTSAFLAGERNDVKLAIIDDKLLDNKDDRKRLMEVVRRFETIIHTKPFRDIGAQMSIDSDCGQQGNKNRYWLCYFAKYARAVRHTVGTCRMGRQGSWKDSVVDPYFRVHRTRALRVVDGSIMPQITNAPITGPIVAIAEKAAANIYNYYSS